MTKINMGKIILLAAMLLFVTAFFGISHADLEDAGSGSTAQLTSAAAAAVRTQGIARIRSSSDTITAEAAAPGKQYKGYTLTAGTTVALYIKVPKAGTLVVATTGSAVQSLYTDTTLQDRISDQGYDTASGARVYYYCIPKAGKYVLVVSTDGTVQTGLSAVYAPSRKTLTIGKTAYCGSQSPKGWGRYKIRVRRTGYLLLQTQPIRDGYSGTLYVILRNRNGKKIFRSAEPLSSTRQYTYIGVKRGTYYLSIRSFSASPMYAVRVKSYSVSISSRGSSSRRAATLKKGHSKKGVVFATSPSRSYYYKIHLTRSQKVTLQATCHVGSGGSRKGAGIRIRIWNSRSSKTCTLTKKYRGMKIRLRTKGSTKLQKGTYYIRVSGYRNGNGYYKIKWN
ncbi:MAG: hypothetical protein ACOYJJ_06130 [Anaerovoracaceae bacterium]|jgi:hypothetical protein